MRFTQNEQCGVGEENFSIFHLRVLSATATVSLHTQPPLSSTDDEQEKKGISKCFFNKIHRAKLAFLIWIVDQAEERRDIVKIFTKQWNDEKKKLESNFWSNERSFEMNWQLWKLYTLFFCMRQQYKKEIFIKKIPPIICAVILSSSFSVLQPLLLVYIVLFRWPKLGSLPTLCVMLSSPWLQHKNKNSSSFSLANEKI